MTFSHSVFAHLLLTRNRALAQHRLAYSLVSAGGLALDLLGKKRSLSLLILADRPTTLHSQS